MVVKVKELYLESKNYLEIHLHIFEAENPKAVVQLIHGMCEHKERYHPFASELVKNGYTVVLSDLRGHGKSTNIEYSLGYFGPDGVDLFIEDQKMITQYILENYPDLPIYLFAHSMGSMIARKYLQEYDRYFRKVILSGAPNYMTGCREAYFIGKRISRKDPKGHSRIIRWFRNGGTLKNEDDLSWLSYNEENIEKYKQDPLCSFQFTNTGFTTLFELDKELHNYKAYQVIRPYMPILFIAGKDDPVIGGQKGLEDSIQSLKKVGYTKISSKVYPNMKHELLNEKDPGIVIKDILEFYDD